MNETQRPASERRRTPRISANFPVTLRKDGKQYPSKAMELSEFGILIVSSQKELTGEGVEVDLALNAARPAVSLKGIVVYTTGTGIAVRFKDISTEQRAVLNGYIESQYSSKPR